MAYIPRFPLPIAKEKIKVGPEPPELGALFESYTAMVPIDLARIDQKLEGSVGGLKEKTAPIKKEKEEVVYDGTIVFENLSKVLPNEKKSKLLNTSTGLGKFIKDAQQRLLQSKLDISIKDPQIELMKSLEPQSEELLLTRASTLNNKKLNLMDVVNVIGKFLLVKTGKIENFGETYAAIAFFKSGTPVLEKLKPIVFGIEKPKTERVDKPESVQKLSEKVVDKEGTEKSTEIIPDKSLSETSPEFAAIATQVTKVLTKDPIEIKLPAKNAEGRVISAFAPSNRLGFPYFMWYVYNKYKLAELPKDFDPDYCKKMKGGEEGSIALQSYQKMVRDYLQQSSPYRGLLVNHGLGSGKSCASIAALESIFAPGNKPIFVFTPASLEPNYVGELMTCGPFVFRLKNYWYFVAIEDVNKPTVELAFLLNVMKMNRDMIKKLNGAWVPVPSKPPNFDSLSSVQQQAIRKQIDDHIHHRIDFHHYNSSTFGNTLLDWACNNPNIFDGATIIIDEFHNLVRKINNSMLEYYYKNYEPNDLAQFVPKHCKVKYNYKAGYLMYRLLRSAVGCKIVALSATPIINFPQEVGIIANVLAGDTRIVNVFANSFPSRDELQKTVQNNKEVDFAEVKPKEAGGTLRFTPIPSGFRKVQESNGTLKGYIKMDGLTSSSSEMNRERDVDAFYNRVSEDIISKIPSVKFSNIQMKSLTRLPDLAEPFIEHFIDETNLTVREDRALLLAARLSGLVSYYKGARPETMPRIGSDNVIEMNMSDTQLGYYTKIREQEIKKESKPVRATDVSAVLKNINSTFKVESRMACDFAFPESIERPRPKSLKQLVEKQIEDGDEIDESTGKIVENSDTSDDAVEETTSESKSSDTPYFERIEEALQAFKQNPAAYFSKENLSRYSPKYQKIIDTIESSPGPNLVYTEFYRLEGVRLFLAAIEHQKNYVEMDIVSDGKGSWTLSETTLKGGKTLRYMTYTGAVSSEKRDILKNIFNGKWEKIPSKLANQVKELAGQDHNRDGNICKIFIITQAGAEGISLSNVRQVHIMEPYWNKVRTEQVKGRAIRTCSHEDLPLDQRVVDIFTYIMKFSKEQIKERKVSETLLNKDEGITTDQLIYNIASGKEKLNNSILDIMKKGAIDCQLFKKENGFSQSCFILPGNETSMTHLFHPDLDTDIIEQPYRKKT
jgi:hypothetical protein